MPRSTPPSRHWQPAGTRGASPGSREDTRGGTRAGRSGGAHAGRSGGAHRGRSGDFDDDMSWGTHRGRSGDFDDDDMSWVTCTDRSGQFDDDMSWGTRTDRSGDFDGGSSGHPDGGPPWDHRPRRSGGIHGGYKPRKRRNWRPHLPVRTWSRVTATVLLASLIPLTWSIGHALTVPGGGSFSARLAEWARDHYLGPIVTFGEWLTYQQPKKGGNPSFTLNGPNAVSTLKHHKKALAIAYGPPPRVASMAGKPLPGEGRWRVLATVKGEPAIYGTYLRASKVYSSYVAGIASMNQNLVKFELRPGTEDPGPGQWHAQPYIPSGTRKGLLATFNSGFKIASSGGGFYLNGARSGALTPGVASEVFYRDGHLAIGVWDHTVRMTPDVVGVRQNLHLIVVHGHVPSTVDQNVETSWGATLGGGYYVWRSGIGITHDGRVIFVYGPSLNVRELAELLQHAGAVTAMELDINPEWMSYMYYLHTHRPNPKPVNLLPTQQEPPDRYYFPSGRDFTAVYAR